MREPGLKTGVRSPGSIRGGQVTSTKRLPQRRSRGLTTRRNQPERLSGILDTDQLTAKIGANFASSGPHHHRLEVFGTDGTFISAPSASISAGTGVFERALLLWGPDPGTAESIDLPYPRVPKGAFIPEFSRSILWSTEPPISEQEVIDALAVCLAIDDSVRSESFVEIDYEILLCTQKDS